MHANETIRLNQQWWKDYADAVEACIVANPEMSDEQIDACAMKVADERRIDTLHWNKSELER